MSFRPLFFALLLSLAAAGTASAQIVIGARIGVGPRYYAPRPRYYAPPVVVAPAYYPPAPVYYAPRPVYYAPRPVYYAPQPYYGRGYYGRRCSFPASIRYPQPWRLAVPGLLLWGAARP